MHREMTLIRAEKSETVHVFDIWHVALIIETMQRMCEQNSYRVETKSYIFHVCIISHSTLRFIAKCMLTMQSADPFSNERRFASQHPCKRIVFTVQPHIIKHTDTFPISLYISRLLDRSTISSHR